MSGIPTITIHSDRRCWKCGKKGAATAGMSAKESDGKSGGICLKCYIAIMKSGWRRPGGASA